MIADISGLGLSVGRRTCTASMAWIPARPLNNLDSFRTPGSSWHTRVNSVMGAWLEPHQAKLKFTAQALFSGMELQLGIKDEFSAKSIII